MQRNDESVTTQDNDRLTTIASQYPAGSTINSTSEDAAFIRRLFQTKAAHFMLYHPTKLKGSLPADHTIASPPKKIAVLTRQLGAGCSGSVYHAPHTIYFNNDTKKWEIKSKKQKSRTIKILRRFTPAEEAMHELTILSQLPEMHAKFISTYCIMMRYVEGIPLLAYLEENLHLLDIEQRLQLALLLIKALEHIHKAKIIHRDIKPENIIITLSTDEPRPVPVKATLIDVGIAKQEGSRDSRHRGTPMYYAPEIWKKLPATYQSDIHMMGRVIWHLFGLSLHFETDYSRPAFEDAFIHHFDETKKIYTRTALDDFPLASINELLWAMQASTPEKRPSIDEVIKHIQIMINERQIDKLIKHIQAIINEWPKEMDVTPSLAETDICLHPSTRIHPFSLFNQPRQPVQTPASPAPSDSAVCIKRPA